MINEKKFRSCFRSEEVEKQDLVVQKDKKKCTTGFVETGSLNTQEDTCSEMLHVLGD